MLRHIWLTIRLPRVLLALLVGAALALSGCVMQGLFRNPLPIRPAGVSSGAALAVACWLVLPLSVPALVALYAPMLAAFIGSIAVMVVIFILSRAVRVRSRACCWSGSPSTRCAARWWGAGLDQQ
jgi:iron complex transport system permease protein